MRPRISDEPWQRPVLPEVSCGGIGRFTPWPPSVARYAFCATEKFSALSKIRIRYEEDLK